MAITHPSIESLKNEVHKGDNAQLICNLII
jgi:hypothetical protein